MEGRAGVRFPALLLMISRKAFAVILLGLVFGAAGSSAVLNSFGTVSGTADVERPLEIKEIHYEEYGGSHSGEYVLLEARTEIDLSEWNMSAYEDGENFNNVSTSIEGKFAIVTNISSVETPEDISVFEVGTIDSSGLANSGEEIIVEYMPEDVFVHRVDYSESDCSVGEAYNASKGDCDSADLDGVTT